MKNTIIKLLLLTLFFVGSAPVFSQVGIGTTNPDASAILDVTATNKGLLLPRVASTSEIASPVNGLVMYDISEKCVKAYENNAWSNCLGVIISPVVTSLECSTATTVGTLAAGSMASAVSFTVNYSGGNQVAYPGEIIPSTGVTGLTAILVDGTLANGSGSVTYTVSGTPNGTSAGTASFEITVGGQSCTVSLSVSEAEPSIAALDCSGAALVGSLVAGTTITGGAGFTVNYSGANGASHAATTVNSTGITGLTATLFPGTLTASSGTLNYIISGTPSGALAGTASFAITIGGQSCTVNLPILGIDPIATLDCAGATLVGSLTSGTTVTTVTSISVNYSDANGASYAGETVNSTGVTGLTATIAAGNLVTGNGALTYVITGTPTAAGTASFAISSGGQACTVDITVLDKEGEVTTSCGVWMDRNLGAENVGDYGDYYQWGRNSDGHQVSTSSTITGPVASGTEWNKFVNIVDNTDWLTPSDDTRWNSGTENNPVKTQNDPCPTGYRIPTGTELSCLNDSNSSDNLHSGSLKLPLSGIRNGSNLFTSIGALGRYWSSTISTSPSALYVRVLHVVSNGSSYANNLRGAGRSVRCIKE